ncbi:hypothetical protein Pint_10880 [Pistacia integerrima]|uniref:Uncharacterized protein n=1 Tax=Pistacia integerrima TaxID=434235 RepID=A0ACC0XID3_9ROSI|nr:hypothetical protein Pint_10880 [Pistacia integerrima]
MLLTSNLVEVQLKSIHRLCGPSLLGGMCHLLMNGSSMPEKPTVVATDYPINPQVHHQITITTGNIITNTPDSGRCTVRRNSFKRSSSLWVLDPKRVLLFFATLSSMGTMLLIYFTLSMSKYNAR